MKHFNIAVIAGDGIGPEVIAEGKKVFSGIAKMDGGFSVSFEDFPWGCEYYLKTGAMMRLLNSATKNAPTSSCCKF